MTVTTTARRSDVSADEETSISAVAATPSAGPKLPRIVRPQNLPRAARPADIPTPDHHHLPGWVRRVHGQVRPTLADIAGNLEGEARTRFDADVAGVVGAISAGRFSVAWQYPRLISDGMALVERQRVEIEELGRQRRSLENLRRKAADMLRDHDGRLPAEASARLQRTLRAAADVEAIRDVEREIQQTATVSRTGEERRREREINRTRQRIRRVVPPGAEAAAAPESWQDTLRKIADQYSE